MSTAQPFRDWIALDQEIEDLQARWQALETWLESSDPAFDPEHTDSSGLPEAAEWFAVDDKIKALLNKRRELLDQLPAKATPDMPGIIAKLSVLARLLPPAKDDHTHELLGSAINELALLAV